MSFVVIPSATIPTTVATGMRSPRMQGTPPICLGSTVIRVNFIGLLQQDSSTPCHDAKHCVQQPLVVTTEDTEPRAYWRDGENWLTARNPRPRHPRPRNSSCPAATERHQTRGWDEHHTSR